MQGILNDRKKDQERNPDDDPSSGSDLEEESINAAKEVEKDAEESELIAGKLKGDKLRALILTPTRELAIQIKNHIQVTLIIKSKFLSKNNWSQQFAYIVFLALYL